MISLVVQARARGRVLVVPAGVVGQVWRDGRKQARLAQLLSSSTIEIEPLDDARARAAGQLCGATKTADIIDASVVLCAQARHNGVVTSDVADIRRLGPLLQIVRV